MSEFKSISVEGTRNTPKIEFNNLTGELILQGRSLPENVVDVYEPLVAWIGEYVKLPRNTTNLYLKLEYFNSASLLWIVQIIKMLSTIDKEETAIYIHLYSDSDFYGTKDVDELKDVFCSVFENIGKRKITAGIKIHYFDGNGNVVDESTTLI